ncbi:hypothetical protein MTQ13_14190 [Streptomyces sp. XM4011]|uniref:hypothetical protein n=1 Tax=Streptomyces sp. XM4011 TaxID=2929780 RepID=UPI001FF7186F|nr:hypothetical protein [Streptomyces sp. XM4011]MCK1815416.1 hypothetical protein [Streptomyces sp. XM4011]
MKTNDPMRRMLAGIDLGTLDGSDISAAHQQVIEEGWTATDDGALLLRGLLERYSGDLHAFHDVVALESAVNGRGVVDWDLPMDDARRRQPLVRRAFDFAYAALARAREQGFAVLAYVSISRADTDEAPLTAHVTMCGVHPELPPYLADPASATEAVAEIGHADLPPRGTR